MQHVTTMAVKQRTLWACVEILKRQGCPVTQTPTETGIRLDITLPPDSDDPHGDRLTAARDATSTTPLP